MCRGGQGAGIQVGEGVWGRQGAGIQVGEGVWGRAGGWYTGR